MKYLFDYWQSLKKGLNNKCILWFLDYDGTLTPIVDRPERVVLSFETKGLLKRLAREPRYRLAIISGRALKDIKKRVGIDKIIYVGNHGLEIEGPKIKFSRPPFDIRRDPAIAGESPVSLRYKRILQHIKEDLNAKLSAIKGVFIEDKGLSLSVHYRLAERNQIPQVKTILQEATILYTVRDKIRIKPGKKVFEIRPNADWDKGKVVLWLLARWKFSLRGKDIMPIYIGDDRTDEDAFRVLKNKGLTIFVGSPKSSCAQYYLRDTEEVTKFLKLILELQK